MRRIKVMRRNRNNTKCYMVVQDSDKNTIELVWMKPDRSGEHPIVTFKYQWDADRQAESEEAMRNLEFECTDMANLLSRLNDLQAGLAIAKWQAEYGVPAGAQIQTTSS